MKLPVFPPAKHGKSVPEVGQGGFSNTQGISDKSQTQNALNSRASMGPKVRMTVMKRAGRGR